MKLDIPLFRQDKDSLDCGLVGVRMLLGYYGIKKEMSELKEEIKIFDNVGTYVPQVGKYLMDNGFSVEIVTINPYLFTSQSANKSGEELIEYFEQLYLNTKKENFKAPLKFFKEFVEAGGKITIRVPTINDIIEEIENNRPLGALITSNFLLYDKPSFNFHYNVITGIDEEFVYVNDPMWDYRGGEQKYKINDFMYAIYASAYGDIDNACLMKITKN